MDQYETNRSPLFPYGRASLRGRIFRECIAAGVKLTGGDIIALGKRSESKPFPQWHPPKNWQYEKVSFPGGAKAEFLVPEGCTNPNIAIMQIHGGGYTLGYLPVFQWRVDKLSRIGGMVPVFSLDYRTAPEHPFPAALEDTLQAVEWLSRVKKIPPESVITIGESAGAGLSLAAALYMRDKGIGTFRAMVLMSPWADLTCRGNSYADRYHMDPMFGRIMPPPVDEMRTSISRVYAVGHDLKDPYLSPVFGDMTGLPPMLIHVGEYEMLFDDSATLYKKAVDAGVDARIKVWPGMFHAFQIADRMIPEARTAWKEIGEFMRSRFD